MQKILTTITLLSTLATADFVGGELNIGYYGHAPSGTLSYKGDTVDLKEDLNLDTQSNLFLKAYLEHPLPFLPNIKVGYSNLTHSGDGQVSKRFTFGNLTFQPSTDLKTELNLKMYDIALYYEILDNWLNLDLGMNLKYIDGYVSAQSLPHIKSVSNISFPVPMLYGKARFDVPTTDLSFQIEGNYFTYNKHEMMDLEIGMRYTFVVGLGLEAGYKQFTLILDKKDDLSVDADFSGMYGKLVWDF